MASDTLAKRRLGIAEGRGPRKPVGAGWLATGDLFRIDADGYLFFEGRISDFVAIRGEKVSLASIRRVAEELPSVIRASLKVYPSRSEAAGFDVVLFVEDPAARPVEDLEKRLRSVLRRAEQPRQVTVLSAPSAAIYK